MFFELAKGPMAMDQRFPDKRGPGGEKNDTFLGIVSNTNLNPFSFLIRDFILWKNRRKADNLREKIRRR